MKPRALLLAMLSAFLFVSFLAAPAGAGIRLSARGPGGVLAGDTIPPEWAGIWTFTDSTYDCGGELLSTDSGTDTLCSGKPVLVDDASPYQLSCTGSTTATTADVTCTYTGEIFPDCTVTLSVEFHAVRTSNSYVATGTTSQQYAGTGKGCDFLTDSCTRTVTYGTRIAGEPTAYCATPVLPATWGSVKSRYR